MPCVLIADDSPVVRLAIARVLRGEGMVVVERDSCASLRELDPGALHCALIDLDLGDGDGTDVATQLRARMAHLPIAFFTGNRSGDSLARATTLGPVFHKPEDLDRMLAWVRENTSDRAHPR